MERILPTGMGPETGAHFRDVERQMQIYMNNGPQYAHRPVFHQHALPAASVGNFTRRFLRNLLT